MQTIGERLEEARKRKGISLREAAEATKIRGDYLLKFESNQYDLNLPEIYVRGFLRSYASFLKLSVEKITADFAALGHPAARSGPRMPSREIYGRMDLSVASGPSTTAVEAQPTAEAAAAPEQPPPRRMPQPFRNNMPSPGIPLDVILKFAVIIVVAALLLMLLGWGAKEIFFAGEKKSQATVVTGEITAAPQPVADQTITLTALGPVEVQVKTVPDERLIYRGTLAAGDRIPVSKHGAVFITYTVGKNLQIEINGKIYGMPTTGYDRVRIE
ncbi:MAG TPA: helix-turn-helix domain-containing protein [Opitutaceae bacterium]|nr:helix-turn-helix domain-containing protein [Opitutaceae bacterium]